MLRCSFCGKTENQVLRMLFGASGCICDDCVITSYQMLLDEGDVELEPPEHYHARRKPNLDEEPFSLLMPTEIKKILDQYIIGQDNAKKTLCVSVYNHYKRTLGMAGGLAGGLKKGGHGEDMGVELQKSNVLLLGPTGVGKTMLAQNLARILRVPFAIADATTLTQAGYVGEDVENVLLRLIQAADYDIESAEQGIIYIDEIDKISRRSENTSITRDVSGEGVQQALLKIIEGTVSSVPPQGGRKHPHQEFIQIDTRNILFICGGAFDGIEKTIAKRIHSSSLGFGAEVKSQKEKESADIMHNVVPEDLVRYGLIPELVGRLPVIATLDELDADALMKILTEPKNALLKQYKYLFELDGIELDVEQAALGKIVEKTIERKTGARGLRSVMESVLSEVMFTSPSDETVNKVIVTEASVESGELPKTERGEPRKRLMPKRKQKRKIG